MAFIRLADYSGNIEVVIFPSIYTKHHALIEPEQCIAIKGRISNRGGGISVIAEEVRAL